LGRVVAVILSQRVDSAGEWDWVIEFADSKAIKASGTNQLGIIRRGDTVELYINGTQVDSLTTEASTSGSIDMSIRIKVL